MPLKGVAHFCSVACFFQIILNSSPVEPPESDSHTVSAHLEFSSRLRFVQCFRENRFVQVFYR